MLELCNICNYIMSYGRYTLLSISMIEKKNMHMITRTKIVLILFYEHIVSYKITFTY